jgi:hypothetical protein
MTEILELAKPYELFVPSVNADNLASLEELVKIPSDDPAQAYKNLMEGVVVVAEEISKNQIPEQKKGIENGTKTVNATLNCSDSAAAILYVCSTINVEAYAHFNGFHISVTASDAKRGLWILERSSATLQEQSDDGSYHATNDAATNMGMHTGAMIWRTQSDGDSSWHREHFDSDDIRSETRRIRDANQVVGRGVVLINTPIAFSMLRAVDVLQTYQEYQLSPKTRQRYLAGKAVLKHLVPKL